MCHSKIKIVLEIHCLLEFDFLLLLLSLRWAESENSINCGKWESLMVGEVSLGLGFNCEIRIRKFACIRCALFARVYTSPKGAQISSVKLLNQSTCPYGCVAHSWSRSGAPKHHEYTNSIPFRIITIHSALFFSSVLCVSIWSWISCRSPSNLAISIAIYSDIVLARLKKGLNLVAKNRINLKRI